MGASFRVVVLEQTCYKDRFYPLVIFNFFSPFFKKYMSIRGFKNGLLDTITDESKWGCYTAAKANVEYYKVS